MHILWVKAGKLLPLDSGGKLRSHSILRHLAENHRVHLLSYYGGDRDPGYDMEIAQQFPGAAVIHTAAPDTNFTSQSFDYLRHLTDPVPYAVTKFAHPQVSQAIRDIFSTRRCDVAVCDFLSASRNFPESSPVPTVLFEHNVESSLWRRLAERETNPIRKLAYTIEARKMARYERRALGWFDHVMAVSRHDRDQLLAMNPSCEVSVVPTGVDTSQYRVVPSASTDPPRVVFTGSMDWEPNIDAAEYFCREIWPAVREAVPHARFQIVGRNPHGSVKRLASNSVEVTGTVPSIFDYLRNATIVVVPLRVGGGTRLKIFEAMAMGKAVVSTSIGAEGLEVENGRHLLLADIPGVFADKIVQLMRDATLRQKYEQSAAELASQFDWSVVARQFAAVLNNVVAESAASTEIPASSPVTS